MSGTGSEPTVDEPPGKDGTQGQHPDTPVPPVPDWAAGENPPGTNPPVPAPVDTNLIEPPGTHPNFETPEVAPPEVFPEEDPALRDLTQAP